ncbi:MAG TPA: low molecular weight protein-tyrosine-phosphatase [Actinomycetes bacterium]|nr:low molecular weight protein-tyrosine-phosphatase [Actinomycetes bacterium]
MTLHVCFVCTGNICRSPMAEHILRHRLEQEGLGGAVIVDSAGLGGWHAGEPADPRTVSALTAHGYPSEHVARQWQPDWFADRDLVIALDGEHARELRLGAPDGEAADKVVLLREFDPGATDDDLDIPDPYYGGSRGFDDVLAMIETAVDGLLEHLRAELAEPDVSAS